MKLSPESCIVRRNCGTSCVHASWSTSGCSTLWLCWGLNVVLVKGAIAQIDPLAFTALRFVAMTPLTFALVYASGQRIRIERRDIVPLILCAAFGYGAYQYVWIFGLANTTRIRFVAARRDRTGLHARIRRHRAATNAFAAAAGSAPPSRLLGIAIFEGALRRSRDVSHRRRAHDALVDFVRVLTTLSTARLARIAIRRSCWSRSR